MYRFFPHSLCFLTVVSVPLHPHAWAHGPTELWGRFLRELVLTGGSRFSVITSREVKMFKSDGWSEESTFNYPFERLLNHPNRVSGYRVTAG